MSALDLSAISAMDWEQKMAALNALVPMGAALMMRRPGDWYLSLSGVSLVEGYVSTTAGSDGTTPEEAVENSWERASKAERLRLPGGGFVHWNGFMWTPVDYARPDGDGAL